MKKQDADLIALGRGSRKLVLMFLHSDGIPSLSLVLSSLSIVEQTCFTIVPQANACYTYAVSSHAPNFSSMPGHSSNTQKGRIAIFPKQARFFIHSIAIIHLCPIPIHFFFPSLGDSSNTHCMRFRLRSSCRGSSSSRSAVSAGFSREWTLLAMLLLRVAGADRSSKLGRGNFEAALFQPTFSIPSPAGGPFSCTVGEVVCMLTV
jgi:hypothetical protein